MHSFIQLAQYCSFSHLPADLPARYPLYTDDGRSGLLDRTFLADTCRRFDLPREPEVRLVKVLDRIESDEILLRMSKFLRWDMCSEYRRFEEHGYTELTPAVLGDDTDYYALLMLLACIEPSMSYMRVRGIPREYYESIPLRRLKPQFKQLEAGNPKVKDLPWDLHFYTCAIYRFDRFLFIPYLFRGPFKVYRELASRRVLAMYKGGAGINRAGRLQKDAPAFRTIWQEEGLTLTANPINPMGFVESEPIMINPANWHAVLAPGDTLLALHVPSGPGYEPSRVRSCMELAMDFFDRYFPELAVKGFHSESWLYDPHLSLILPANSRIVQVRRQFYCYPTEAGDSMLRYELFGDRKADPSGLELNTSLQRQAAAYMAAGGTFSTTGMFVLREEIARVGTDPYIRADDVRMFRQMAMPDN